MSIMGCRYIDLMRTIAGYKKTGMQLVGCDGVATFPSEATGDDVGLYYFVPKLMRFFDCSLDRAISLFFNGMLLAGCFIGIIGFFLYSKSWLFRAIAASGLVLFSCYVRTMTTDNYLVPVALAMAIVPWGLYFLRRGKIDWLVVMFFCLTGIVCGYGHFIRSCSSFPMLLLLVCVVFFIPASWWRRGVLLIVLGSSVMISFFHMHVLFEARKPYFDPSYSQIAAYHPLWHAVYAGFGFLNNDSGIKWDDDVVRAHAKSIDPQAIYPSHKYEMVVQGMVCNLFKNHKDFVIQTFAAKAGVILFWILIFANIGLVLAFLYRKPWQVELILWLALLTSSVFGFIALPGRWYPYTLGMHALAFLYCLISIEYALRQGMVTDVSTWCKRAWRKIKRRISVL